MAADEIFRQIVWEPAQAAGAEPGCHV